MDLQLEDLKNYVKLAREGAYFGKYSEAVNTFKKAIESVQKFKSQVSEQYVKQAWQNFEMDLQSELDVISELLSVNQGFKPQQNAPGRQNIHQALQGGQEGKEMDQKKIYPFGKAPFSHIEDKGVQPQSADCKIQQKNLYPQQGAYIAPPQTGYGAPSQASNQGGYHNHAQGGYGAPQEGYQPQPPQGGYSQQNNHYNLPNPGYSDNIFSDNNNHQPGYGNGEYPKMPRTGENFRKDPSEDPDIWPAPPPQSRKQNKQPQKKTPVYNLKELNNQPNAGNAKDQKRNYPKPWQKNTSETTPNGKKKGDVDGEKKKSFLHFVYPDGSGPDSDLITMLERDVVDQNPNISFDQIAELDKAKDMLQEAVLLPILIPQYFRGIRRPLKGVMMFGPPGTGKTMLAKAVATTGKTTFFNVSASSLASKWRGDSEKLVRILFEMARFYSPSTIFFDEIDAIGSKRVDGECEANRKMKAEMLIQIDGVSSSSTDEKDRKQVMVLAATNRPWDLDEALRRRLEKRILIPLPSTEGRMQLFKLNMKGINCSDEVNWDDLVKKTNGYSGADIASLCREAAFMPMRRKLMKEGGFKNIDNIENLASESDIPLTQKDFEDAQKNVNKSVSNDDLENFEKWMAEFGSV